MVPPVTAERSPPASRMTGADSPVMADSLTLAAPSMISPSAAISSFASTTKMSPFRSVSAATVWMEPSDSSLRATLLLRLLRRASAWALPRPSAMASAKLAKMTVNQSQREIWATKAIESLVKSRSSVVSAAAPTSVTNITGFFHMWKGLSFLKLSMIAGMTIAGSNKGRALPAIVKSSVHSRIRVARKIRFIRYKNSAAHHDEVFDDRAHRQTGQEVERADDHDDGDDEQDERRPDDREAAGVDGGRGFFMAREPARARAGMSSKYRPINMQKVCVQLKVVLA